MTEDVLLRMKALDPAPGDLPEAIWSPAVVLQGIDERSTTVQTHERQTKSPPPRRNRGWLLAAAVAALVVLVGAIVIGLLSADSGTDVVQPVPTTLSAPTTVPPPTTMPPATTQPPASTVPVTEAPVGEEATATIAEIIATSAAGDPAEFTVLLTALETAGLVDALSTPGDELTVFAPTDAAFDGLLVELGVTEQELLAHPDLSSLLLYHVAPGLFDSAAVVASTPIATLNPRGVELSTGLRDGAVIIYRWRFGEDQPDTGEAQVTSPDIAATNGVVHVIDAVLVPSWVQFPCVRAVGC